MMSFHLFVSFSISFNSVFSFLVDFIAKCFVLFAAVVNGSVFFISCSDCPLLVCGNTTDFCMLTLYPATLLFSFTSSKAVFVEFLGFSTYKIMSPVD